MDGNGLAKRGLLVRHLVMPNGVAGTREIAIWLAKEISPDTYINLMDQYHPEGEVLRARSASRYADVARGIVASEFRHALSEARRAGLARFDQRRVS